MKVAAGRIVAIEYRLHLGDGQVIDQNPPGQPLPYLHGRGQIVPGLEKALEGLEVGQQKQVVVSPDQGYGEHNPEGVRTVPRTMLPAGFSPQVGQTLMAQTEDGNLPLTITQVNPDSVVVDLNPPLAGKTLHFDVTVREVRDATPEELQHGHAHGPGGAHG